MASVRGEGAQATLSASGADPVGTTVSETTGEGSSLLANSGILPSGGNLAGRSPMSPAWPASTHTAQMIEVQLLTRFLELSGTPVLSRTSWNRCLKTIEFLRACEYTLEEVCSVLALASKYFLDQRVRSGARMNEEEAGHVMVVVAYLAHSYALDETCPLSVWHRCLSGSYCAFSVMNAAVVQLMRARGYILRVEDDEFLRRFLSLRTSAMSCSQ